MTTSDDSQALRRHGGRWESLAVYGFALLVSLALTAATLQASARFGRLAHTPIWDDIGTFDVAGMALERMYRDGPGALVSWWAQSPPHQPYAVLLSIIGFATLGISEKSAYAMCFVHVFTMLAFAAALLRGLGVWPRLLGVLLVSTAPLTTHGVNEIKPDFFAGFCLAFAAIYALRRPVFDHPRRGLWLGVLFAGVLMGKPSVFAQTFVLAGMIWTLALLADLFDGGPRPTIRRIALTTGAALGSVTLLFGPHFAVAGAHLWRYMIDNVFSPRRELWSLKGTWQDHALHYLTGPGSGSVMLGGFLWVAVTLIALGVLAALARRRRSELARGACLGLALLGLYLVPTVNAVKNHILGLGFQSLLVLGSVLAVREVWLWVSTWRGGARRAAASVAGVLLAGATVWGAMVFDFTFGLQGNGYDRIHFTGIAGQMRARDEAIKRVYEQLALRCRSGPKTVLMANGVANINENLLGFWSFRDGLDMRPLVPVITDARQLRPLMAQADLALASDRFTGLAIEFEPRSALQADMLRLIQSDPSFREVYRTQVAMAPGHVYIFENVVDADGFAGFEDVRGLRALGGPFPQWNLPKVRWAERDIAVRAAGLGGRRVILKIHAYSPVGAALRVFVGDRQVGQLRLGNPAHTWRRRAFIFDLPPGQEDVRLVTDKAQPDGSSVLFRTLIIEPHDGPAPAPTTESPEPDPEPDPE
jgi:hypothetical protein